MDYLINNLYIKRSKRDYNVWNDFLTSNGIKSEKLIDRTIALYDNNTIIATGSTYKNIIKCVAVSLDYQGGTVFNKLISILMSEILDEYQNIYVYTKPTALEAFKSLGFNELASVDNELVFLEKAINGIKAYCDKIETYRKPGNRISSIVMHANPFTNGHLYLIEKAASNSDHLFVFVLSENMSRFSPDVRIKLVKSGVAHLENVTVLPTDSYIVSNNTFPSYFLKEGADVTRIQAKLDATIFLKWIAPSLGINYRYLGEEPMSFATNIYNEEMSNVFKDHIEVIIIPRIKVDNDVISASSVRHKLVMNNMQEIKEMVPKTTYDFLNSKEGKVIQEQIIKDSKNETK